MCTVQLDGECFVPRGIPSAVQGVYSAASKYDLSARHIQYLLRVSRFSGVPPHSFVNNGSSVLAILSLWLIRGLRERRMQGLEIIMNQKWETLPEGIQTWGEMCVPILWLWVAVCVHDAQHNSTLSVFQKVEMGLNRSLQIHCKYSQYYTCSFVIYLLHSCKRYWHMLNIPTKQAFHLSTEH